MHKTGVVGTYQCQPCTPALMVLGGLSFSAKTSEKPSIRSLMSSFQSWQHQKKPSRDVCTQRLNLARNNNKAKKQCHVSFREAFAEPHSVFSWSKSIREGICWSADAGDAVPSMLVLPMTPLLCDWPWLHLLDRAAEQVQGFSWNSSSLRSCLPIAEIATSCLDCS